MTVTILTGKAPGNCKNIVSIKILIRFDDWALKEADANVSPFFRHDGRPRHSGSYS